MIFIYHDIFEHYATNIKHISFHCLSLVFVRFDSFGSVRFGFISYFDVLSWCRIIFNFWYELFLFLSVSFMRSWVYFFFICISVPMCVSPSPTPLSIYLSNYLSLSFRPSRCFGQFYFQNDVFISFFLLFVRRFQYNDIKYIELTTDTFSKTT